MVIMTKDRGKLKAKKILILIGKSHDFLVQWEDDGWEHMRKSEIEFIEG